MVALLLRTAQWTALVLWIALLGCAEHGWAAAAGVMGVLVLAGMCVEAAFRSSIRGPLLASAIHLALLGGIAAAFHFGDIGGHALSVNRF